MTTENPVDRLEKIEGRLEYLEAALTKILSSASERRTVADAREAPVAPWQFLVRRQHAWRQQLYLKGRNMTVRQLVGSIKANRFDDETAAANHHLPIDAIREALAYVEQNPELLATEAEIERLMHQRAAHVPQLVS